MTTAKHGEGPCWRRIKGTLEPDQWGTMAMMGGVVLLLHVVGFFLLFVLVAPHHYVLGGGGAFSVGVGMTAYTLGMRHAFDADHISAIDNTTRKLMSEGKRPISVGFFFSLGHSTIVFLLTFLFAIGLRALSSQVTHRNSHLHNITGWIGNGVSGVFLYIIAALNLVILAGLVRVFREMRRGRYSESEFEHQLDSRGLMNRFFRRPLKMITKPVQMYLIGILFGLGFDTATEVALLFLAATAAGASLPFYAILCLPVLFAAGMSLLDTLDGSFMNFAYGWAFSNPIRKIYYNLAITGLSVAIAMLIGTIELGGIIAAHIGARGPFWDWFINININELGFIIVCLFVLTWAVALLIWRVGKIEERWGQRATQDDILHP